MLLDVEREKCLQALGSTIKYVGWVLGLMVAAKIGLRGDGVGSKEHLAEALDDLESAMTEMKAAHAYLTAETTVEQDLANAS